MVNTVVKRMIMIVVACCMVLSLPFLSVFAGLQEEPVEDIKNNEAKEKSEITEEEILEVFEYIQQTRMPAEVVALAAPVLVVGAGACVLYQLEWLLAPEIIKAARKSDVEKMEKLYQTDSDVINQKDMWGWTSLHYAVSRNDENVFDFLLAKGAVLDGLDNEDVTPLHCAVNYKRTKMVQGLVNNGADLTISNGLGYTPAELAHVKGYFTIKNSIINGNKGRYEKETVFDSEKIKNL